MKDVFIWFWSAMIFSSIAWYAALILYVGIKGGYEILQMTRALSEREEGDDRVGQ
jgi:hypothetical protein